MAKYKVLKFVDNERAIGAVVEKTTIFGTSVWVRTKNSSSSCRDNPGFDLWVNRDTAKALHAITYGEDLENYYQAQKLSQGV